jgi:hypothetical protein
MLFIIFNNFPFLLAEVKNNHLKSFILSLLSFLTRIHLKGLIDILSVFHRDDIENHGQN